MKEISSVLQIALGGIRRELRELERAAHEVATAPVRRSEPTELVDPLVQALKQQRALEASAAVLRRADEALDSVLEAVR